MSNCASSSSWYMPGRADPIGCGVARPSIVPRTSGPFDEHLVLVAEDQGMRLDIEALDLLTADARGRVGPEESRLLNDLGARQRLEHRVHLADRDRPAEWPA